MNLYVSNDKNGSSSTISILLQNGINNYAVNPHFPPIINTELEDFLGKIRESLASNASTTSLLSFNSLCN
jgi:hypothetical protein